MYLHLGQETVVQTESIIGIFDIDNTTVSKFTRNFLNSAEKRKQVINITTELPRSFVLVKNDDGFLVYISQLSPATLEKRTRSFKYTPESNF